MLRSLAPAPGFRLAPPGLAVLLALGPAPAPAIVNPDISVIGQPRVELTTDPAAPDRERPRLDPGEVEIVFDARLNPQAKGTIVLALAGDGLELEEAFFRLHRGLPGRLALEGGQHRLAFGKMNQAHPHALPFAERFRVLERYLPGDEAFIETGISLSALVPLPAERSLELSGGWLQGDSFRIAREPSGSASDPLVAPEGDRDRSAETRAAFAGRASAFAMLGERSGLEAGASLAHGTNNVAAGTRTTLLGLDVKAKLWTSARSHLLLQGEALKLWQNQASWDPLGGYSRREVRPFGGYVYADMSLDRRYDLGAGYERYAEPEPGVPVRAAVKLFAGYSLLEETTVFRFDWDRQLGGESQDVDTFTLRAIYSMGPHKAHEF